MKKIFVLAFLLISALGSAQAIDYNTKKGYVANGYDVVAYFDGQAVEGNNTFSAAHDGVDYKFSSQENLEKFQSDPEKYVPQYGGYCAYAVATSGKKVNVNPETFEIRDGQLLLFYNAGKTNTLQLWLKESPEKLKLKADQNWEEVKLK
ncbi:YHS domain-containing (seleno)protein [Flagellimonas allohymeniacidonis]|uniref:YHS domain-containing protein n=1 Tax=Flagellimonas allohymeniacidonis TaxID=2517819 RepID=A0A4Q8QBR9_9FLAO|nr:YHS domain-containing (seleno)protein [Allomuricauda hymeniacidonis]TAI46847.1 YHS domain-containing protein [Allomuricauda hymeniacidonis]